MLFGKFFGSILGIQVGRILDISHENFSPKVNPDYHVTKRNENLFTDS